MSSRFDISYCLTDPENLSKRFDLHVPTSVSSANPQPLIIFVHGGAWRSEDKSDHTDLANKLVSASKFPVAVPNYRLTTSNPGSIFRHPGHASDLVEFLTFIVNHPDASFNSKKLILIGHSCSAHMLCSIVLDSKDPTLVPSSHILDAVQAVIMSEGIYSLSMLISRSPNYQDWFVEPAFGPEFDRFGVATLAKHQFQKNQINWVLIHSLDDDLVHLEQSTLMYDHLASLESGPVFKDFSFRSSHNGVLSTPEYVSIVAKFSIESTT